MSQQQHLGVIVVSRTAVNDYSQSSVRLWCKSILGAGGLWDIVYDQLCAGLILEQNCDSSLLHSISSTLGQFLCSEDSVALLLLTPTGDGWTLIARWLCLISLVPEVPN